MPRADGFSPLHLTLFATLEGFSASRVFSST
jgi:hypothetical protein